MTLETNSSKKKQKEKSREVILETAARLFRKQGFKATGIDQVMQEADLTAGAFYFHFKSKEDLLKHVLVYSVKDTRKKLVGGIEDKSPREKLSLILGRYCSKVHRDQPELGCVLPSIASELHRTDAEIGPLVAEYVEKWIGLTSDLLNQIESHDSMEIRTKAINLISQSVGAVLLSRVLGQTELSDEVLKSARTPMMY
jgi:TetR/AcrR family transcriptional regulator, transcriptional repressor for nem operon